MKTYLYRLFIGIQYYFIEVVRVIHLIFGAKTSNIILWYWIILKILYFKCESQLRFHIHIQKYEIIYHHEIIVYIIILPT